MSQGSSTSASPIYSKANTPPQKSPHPSDSFQRERIQRHYASPEESDDPIPIFTTPTNMYIREELNPRPRFTSPRPRNSYTTHRNQFDPLANKYQTNNHIPQKTNTSPKDFDINGRSKHTSSSSTGDKLNKDIPKTGKTFVNPAQASQKDEILAQLVDMGFNLKDARIALATTNSTNLQDVLDFLIQNTNSNDQQVPEAADSSDDEDPSIERAKEEAWRYEQEERRKEYLDQLKKVNTEKERKQGNFYFNQGKFTDAEKSYSIAISSLPADHKDLVLLYNNRAAARLKLGHFVACLDDCSLAIGLASKNTELKADLTEGVSSWKSQWLKALHRKACALEGLKMYEIAIQVYEDYARLDGVRNSIVSQGILRCQQAAQPQQQQSTNGPHWKASKDTTTAFPDIDFSIFVPKKSNVNMDEINASKAVREMREREKKKEAEDAERLEKEDKVNAHLKTWKSGKEKNLRALLSSLEQILWTGIEWKGVTMTELLEPRKCKITYMKAIAKVHPDKLSSKATVEQRLLASGIFTTLNQAWDTFRTENNL
ncbi:hypothetical protein G6F43_006334 [Rhizopus delemar]|nr:hypothetical protein G6F43_006334 [Rhizopus delemar]